MTDPINFIVILGFWNYPDGTLPESTIARLNCGLEIYRKYPSASIILSGGFGKKFNTGKYSHAEYNAKYLKVQGIAPDKIVLLTTPTNTVAEAISVAEYLNDKIYDKLCLVTSSFHIPRAQLIFSHFFAASVLEMAPTGNCGIAPEELATRKIHEKTQIKKIKEQGGIFVNDELVKIN